MSPQPGHVAHRWVKRFVTVAAGGTLVLASALLPPPSPGIPSAHAEPATTTAPRDIARDGIAVASSEYPGAAYAARNAIDGDAKTRWAAASKNDGDWISVKLATPSPIYKVVIDWQNAYSSSYDIQTSDDGTTWTTAKTVQNSGPGVVETVLDISDPVGYVRMLGLVDPTKWGYSIWSFEIWDGDPSAAPGPTDPPDTGPAVDIDTDPAGWAYGTDVALEGTALASSEDVAHNFLAAYVNDGDASTRWQSKSGTTGDGSDTDWIQIKLTRPSPIWAVVFRWQAARPAHYQIQISNDGTTWTTVKDLVNAPAGIDEHTLGVKDPVQYVRMQGLQLLNPKFGDSLFSFEVWSGPEAPPAPGGTIVPAVVSQTALDAQPFTLNAGSKIVAAGSKAHSAATRLAEALRPSTGFALPIVSGAAGPNDILLSEGDAPTGAALAREEGYSLEASAAGLSITAATAHGLFNGAQTLLQLLPSWVVSASVRPGPWTIDATSITDYPRFTQRSVMLDPARNFLTVHEVEKVIDSLAMLKGNTLHLHLSDNQGWRIAISSRPKLAEVGGAMSIVGGRKGFYTQDDFREIVAYANARFIDVIPEIDMPSHSGAALAAYPELDCGVATTLCPSAESTFEFLDDVIAEVAALSPSKYLHIGGDESPYLSSTQYADFIKRAEGIVRAHGKTMEGWNPTPAAGIDPSSVHEFWNAQSNAKWNDGVSMAVKPGWFANGNPVVLAPTTNVYLDYPYYSHNTLTAADWSPATILKAFGLRTQDVLGLEAPIWGERNTLGLPDVEFKLFPRLASVLDLAWAPATRTVNPQTMLDRIKHLGSRWQFAGVNAYADPVVSWTTDMVGSSLSLPSPDTAQPHAMAATPGVIDTAVATIASPDKTLSAFGATVDWGDGSPVTPATITGTDARGALVTTGNREASHHTGASLYEVHGTHGYAADGTYTGHVTVTTNDAGPREVAFTVTVGSAGPVLAPPVITSGAPPNATVGVPYRFTIAAIGQPTPTFRVSAGELPAGLAIDSTSGVISGAASKQGSFAFTITAENGQDPAAIAEYVIDVSASTSTTAPGGSGQREASAPLATTGSDIGWWLLGAAMLLLSGAGLLAGRRAVRRQSD